GGGVLTRRAELGARRAEVAELEEERAELSAELERLEAAAREARATADALEIDVAEADAERREAKADRASTEARLERLREERHDLTDRIEQLEAFHESRGSSSPVDEERRAALEADLARAEAAHADAVAAAEEARSEAEAARDELHRAQLERARVEADLETRREVMRRIAENLEETERRLTALDEERLRLEGVIRDGERTASAAEEAIGSGLDERAERESRLAGLEEEIARRRERLEDQEAQLKEARRAERERTERRHALELEVTQLQGARSSVHERLEAEWDAPLDELRSRVELPDEEDADAWEEELAGVRRSIARIGPVNLLAQQEYEEEKTRLEFLTDQRDDLLRARDDLRASIRRINEQATEAFSATFEQVRENFRRTFDALFQGGECDLWLDDPDDPLDSPIEISASPRGKKTQRIHLLSGGERALTALALLFAIYLAKPSPFCLLDEVDAPLDETNILRFVHMLEEFKSDTQFIVITHNPRTMEGADWIYGVTMQEPGVSSIVGVEFDQATQVA
ncbi:MAG: AAA family ATPase, partial [Gemmatimonadota bacterium]|nr:AAA family ATPase [Gemmatimonadota bacterium]